MYKIVADSSCDIMKIENVCFESVPLTISTDERDFSDDANLDCHNMLDYLANYNGRSYTACPSCKHWINAFDENADEIYVVSMTSGLSGTYNSALTATDIFQESHPDVKILCIDTLTTGPEMRLVIEKIIELKEKGTKFESMEFKIKEYLKHTCLLFSLSSLHNFVQNGRISRVLGASVGLLGIRILGKASPEGTLSPIAKCRGNKKMVTEMIAEIQKAGYQGGKLRLGHVENEVIAEKIKNAVTALFPHADIAAYPTKGLCSYYAERGGILIGFEF